MNRRDHLKLGGLAAFAAVASPLTAGAVRAQTAATLPPIANLSIYRYRVGDFSVTAIQDGMISRPGYHFPFPAHGYIRREGSAYAYVPAPWMPV